MGGCENTRHQGNWCDQKWLKINKIRKSTFQLFGDVVETLHCLSKNCCVLLHSIIYRVVNFFQVHLSLDSILERNSSTTLEVKALLMLIGANV